MTRHAVTPHNGICHQGVRSEDTRQQQRGAHAESQIRHPYPHADAEGDAERQHPEYQSLPDVLLQVLQVHFQTGKEHDVVDTHLAEELETAVPLQDVEAILADDHPRQNHADDVRNTQAPQDDGRKKDNHQHQKEYPSGVRDG